MNLLMGLSFLNFIKKSKNMTTISNSLFLKLNSMNMKYYFSLAIQKSKYCLCVLLCTWQVAVWADEKVEPDTAINPDSILGKWYVLHPKTSSKVMTCSVFKESEGTYFAKVDYIFPNPSGGTIKYCNKCPAPYRGKSLYNMVILWNMTPTKSMKYIDAKGIDPKSGHIYPAEVSLDVGLNKLSVSVKQGDDLGYIREYWVKARD